MEKMTAKGGRRHSEEPRRRDSEWHACCLRVVYRRDNTSVVEVDGIRLIMSDWNMHKHDRLSDGELNDEVS